MTRPAGIKNNKGDRRYLWRRGSRWWVQVRVPDDLRPRIGKKAIQISLHTSDLNEARRLRWPHVHSIREMFRRALADEDMTSEEIERFAQAEYQRQVTVEKLNIEGDINSALADQITELAWELEHGPEAASMPDGEVIEPRNPVIEEIEATTGVTLVLLRKSGEHLLKQEVFYGARNQVYDGVQARGGAPGADQWPATG